MVYLFNTVHVTFLDELGGFLGSGCGRMVYLFDTVHVTFVDELGGV